MELHQLRCFMAIIEEGGFNRATTRLHITQPALSYQIKQLEQELGVRLFNRRPRGVSPTEAGRVLFEHTKEVMETVRQARRAVEELAEGVAGEIRIGTINSVGIYFLPQVLWITREIYPTASPTVLYRNNSEILEALLSNSIDLALVANPRADRRLQQETIIEERVSLVCGQTHPFYGRDVVRPSELKGMPFISLSQDSPTGRIVSDLLARLGVSVKSVASTDNVETVKKMVEIGLGAAFLPDMVTRSEVACAGGPKGSLSRIDVGPPIMRRIALVTWKQFEMSQATEAFVEELRQYGSTWKGCLESENSDA
ncbi:MAG: LysR family transcriptional regulator [Deltaproteobacteria bacterium]|nr:LysR family transcriptional regulator [Deltaproteobacteria bacterium]